MHYPGELPIQITPGPIDATVSVPGSKSITNRALVLAALGDTGVATRLRGVLKSEDTEVMTDCLTRLGFLVEADWDAATISVTNPSRRLIPAESAELDCKNSGTTMRFLTALVALGDGDYRLDGVPRMRERPIRDLLGALQQLGVDAISETASGCPPVRVRSRGVAGGNVTLRADVSSQYLSGLLLAAPRASQDILLQLDGPPVSEPYIAMTLAMLRFWGATITEQPGKYSVSPGLTPPRNAYAIEPDASAASYFWALAPILGGRVTVRGLTRNSLQGDVAFVDVLAKMGCRVVEYDGNLTVESHTLRGITVDMGAISDTVMTLAAVACFADGPTRMTNIGHIRHKETDRIAAVATELRKLGAQVQEEPDALTITPGPLTGVAVDTYDDHRMAMSLALIGLRVPGVVVRDPGCVRKTYPNFWHDLESAVR